MAPLVILVSCFALIFLVSKFILKSPLSFSLIGRIPMAVMLIVTGGAHFTNTNLMVQMMPDIIPFKKEIVYLTGALEILASIGLLTTKYARLTSILLILFFLAILPANIIGSLKEVELGGMENGPAYLYFRIPLQLFFVWWVYYFGIRLKPGL